MKMPKRKEEKIIKEKMKKNFYYRCEFEIATLITLIYTTRQATHFPTRNDLKLNIFVFFFPFHFVYFFQLFN